MKVDKHAVGGLGGMIGRKKGAVAMYINLSGIRMVFVSCHLAGWFSISGLCFRLPSVSLVFLKLLPIHYYNASSIRYQYGYTRQPRQWKYDCRRVSGIQMRSLAVSHILIVNMIWCRDDIAVSFNQVPLWSDMELLKCSSWTQGGEEELRIPAYFTVTLLQVWHPICPICWYNSVARWSQL